MLGALRRAMAGGAGRRVALMLLALVLANALLWGGAFSLLRHYTLLLGTALLAYGFGLRHAVDADHIAAIDNVTRKLMQQGQRPVGVGLAFSLGHSTIVFALSAAVALTAAAIQGRFNALSGWGALFGTLVSGLFLLGMAALNLSILLELFRSFRRVRKGGAYREEELDLLLARRGFFARLFRGLFGMVQHSWQMYPIGLLFGLGFDTATEVGLLGISAAAGSKGLPIWTIMIFPALFTAGMALIDTADSILMLGAYGWAFMKPMRKLFYNLTITAVSVLVAVGIGGIELLGMIQGAFALTGRFWDQISWLNDDAVFGLLGYVIVAVFVVAWLASVAIYKFKRYDELEIAPGD
nr:HoxN/HupN/NixA family nickel/cobalt transporter [uncultured Acidocella sp.]